MNALKPLKLQDLVGMSFKKFQNNYSVETDPGHFERRLYLGSNEILEDVYPRLRNTKGVGLAVLGGVDQTLTLISSSRTALNILADVNPKAVVYGNIRLGLTQIADNAQEYLQRLTGRKVSNGRIREFQDAMDNCDYSRLWGILREHEIDSEYIEETHSMLSEAGFVAKASNKVAKEVLATVAVKTDIAPGKYKDRMAKERSMELFFNYFSENPSNWLFNSGKYDDIKRRVRAGEIKIIQENIFENTLSQLSNLFEQAGLTVGYFYDSNALFDADFHGVTKLLETMKQFPTDENSLWVSCDSSGMPHVRNIKSGLEDAEFIKAVKSVKHP